MSETARYTAAAAAAPAGGTPGSLFVVERRLPKITGQQLAVLQAALTGAVSRFSARGEGVRYVCSISMAGQGRVLSLFIAPGIEAVRAVNEASLVPFASIEPAVERLNPGLVATDPEEGHFDDRR